LRPLFTLLALALAQPLAAASLRDCDTPTASAANLWFPGEDGLRSFANGAIRMLWLDTNEPACCSSHLMVVMAHPTEMGQSCWLVSADGGNLGFGGFDLRGATASYDPSRGLTVAVPANIWQGDGPAPSLLVLTLNQATLSLAVEERPR
jgi:hypothetical protein